MLEDHFGEVLDPMRIAVDKSYRLVDGNEAFRIIEPELEALKGGLFLLNADLITGDGIDGKAYLKIVRVYLMRLADFSRANDLFAERVGVDIQNAIDAVNKLIEEISNE